MFMHVYKTQGMCISATIWEYISHFPSAVGESKHTLEGVLTACVCQLDTSLSHQSEGASVEEMPS